MEKDGQDFSVSGGLLGYGSRAKFQVSPHSESDVRVKFQPQMNWTACIYELHEEFTIRLSYTISV